MQLGSSFHGSFWIQLGETKKGQRHKTLQSRFPRLLMVVEIFFNTSELAPTPETPTSTPSPLQSKHARGWLQDIAGIHQMQHQLLVSYISAHIYIFIMLMYIIVGHQGLWRNNCEMTCALSLLSRYAYVWIKKSEGPTDSGCSSNDSTRGLTTQNLLSGSTLTPTKSSETTCFTKGPGCSVSPGWVGEGSFQWSKQTVPCWPVWCLALRSSLQSTLVREPQRLETKWNS